MPSVLYLKEKITKFPRFHYTNILYFNFQHDPICRVRVERYNNLRGRCLDSLWCCMRYWLPANECISRNNKRISWSRSGHSDQHLPAPCTSPLFKSFIISKSRTLAVYFKRELLRMPWQTLTRLTLFLKSSAISI